MTSTLNVKAFYWIMPVAAKVKVADLAWHKKGDVNWDGVIDQIDIDLLTSAFGSHPGDPNWDPNCDLNGDGKIDTIDMWQAASNFGKTSARTTPFTATVVPGRCVLTATYKDYILTQDFKVTDKASSTILFEFNFFKGRAVILGGAGGSGGGLVKMPTGASRPEIRVEL